MYTLPQHPAIILIVDEDPLARTQTAATLGMSGYACHAFGQPEQALQFARQSHLDLLICDATVDHHSGLALFQQLRQLAQHADLPALFVTSDPGPDLIHRVHQAGGTYCLRKPFDPDVLVELVGKALWMPHLVRTALERTEPASHPRPAGLRRLLNPTSNSSRSSTTDSIW